MSSPALQLFAPSDVGGQVSADMTVSALFEAYVLPVCMAQSRPLHIKEMRTSLRYWERFTESAPLRSITGFTTARFVRGLCELQGPRGETISDNTVRKHCVHVQRVLDVAGPKRRKQQVNLGLLVDAPYILKPAGFAPEVQDVWTLDEIGLLLEACYVAKVPKLAYVSPPDWWRCLLLNAYNSAFRVQTLLACRHSWIQKDEQGLNMWHVPAKRDAIKRGRPKQIYCNEASQQALKLGRGHDLCHEWPHQEGYFHEWRREILAASKISKHRRFGFHALRKACATELAEINPFAASRHLGHSVGRGLSDTTAKHYIHSRVYAAAVERLPQPVMKCIRVDPQRSLPGFDF